MMKSRIDVNVKTKSEGKCSNGTIQNKDNPVQLNTGNI